MRTGASSRSTRPASSLAITAVLSVVIAACGAAATPTLVQPTTPPPASSDAATPTATAEGSLSGARCPMVFDASTVDFYPIQPSFSAGYTVAAQKLSDETESWAYVIEGDFPYVYWMAWYVYTTKGVPLLKLSGAALEPDPGSTNPYVDGNPILAPQRHYRVVLMPSTTPANVIQEMQQAGKNVGVLPATGTTEGISIVSRAYWSLAFDDLGDWDRFGYRGPTNTPPHTITAHLTDPTTGELTDAPVTDCGSQSQLPERIWYDAERNAPIVTFADVAGPSDEALSDIPHYLLQTGSVAGVLGAEFPPAPDPRQVQFYRNVAANTPYADVSAAPAQGDPPDACGGYVMANLPNDVVSLVHIPRVPSFPDYSGATSSTLNDSGSRDVQFYSIVVYGASKQEDAPGTPNNSQIGNRQILVGPDGSATVVVWPQSATEEQVGAIAKVAEANGWNVLRGGLQTAVAPGLMVVREKGANDDWANSLSPNKATDGAPCPQTANPSLPLAEDPPSAQVTQFNGMGLSAPQGVNCSIEEFLSGACLDRLGQLLASTGAAWSASSKEAPEQAKP